MASLLEREFNALFYLSTRLPERLSDIKAGQQFATRPIAEAERGNWKAPANVDIQGLANEIWFLREEYPRWVKLDSDAEAKRRHARLNKLVKALSDVSRLYSTDALYLERQLFSGWRENANLIRAFEELGVQRAAHGLHDFSDGVRLLQSLVAQLIDANVESGFDKLSEYPLQHFTPTRLLAVTLARLAKKYLDLDDRITRDPNNGNSLGGPFIRFSMAVLAEIGCALTDESIAKAVKQNRSRIARQRRREG
ncbi:MAG: hypothetical protein NTZ14_01850 [Hyphomicrobiales bacterium]|nr:hypothetical protein [Hyphomicrobiales bacterium]